MLTTVGALAHVPSYAATPAGPEMVHNSGVACGLQCCCLVGVARLGVTLGGGRAVAVDAGAMPPRGTFRRRGDDPLLPHPAGIVLLFFFSTSLVWIQL